jgi:hypothetical protein
MENKLDYNALGQVIDTTWGRSSTPQTASYSVKLTLQGADKILASYVAVVNFGTERQLIEMKRRYADESASVIDATVKQIKKNYKDLTSSAVTFKEVSSQDSLEIIGLNVHNPKRTAYYRRQVIFEVG